MIFRDIQSHSIEVWRKMILQRVARGERISALFAKPPILYAVLVDDEAGSIAVMSTEITQQSYPSLTPDCVQAHLFEREIKEQWGIIPEGHPWAKPVRKMNQNFYKVEGDEIHEVAVGPVHAGVIEPGHFRFQCHGEDVLHLEIALGYQHRGIEKALVAGPNKRTLHYMETAAGDTSVGHALAYSQLIESLSQCEISDRANALRAIALELERLANHTGDLGALANDVGYLPTAAYCGRLRGDFLNLTALLCGSRLGRGFIRPGGTGFDVDAEIIRQLQDKLKIALQETTDAVSLLWESPSVLSRFEYTGVISEKIGIELGLVGVAARACGIHQDIRLKFPFGVYQKEKMHLCTWTSGDVFARAYVRWLEIKESVSFILRLLESLPPGQIQNPLPELAKNSLGVFLVEGWRGEICHVGITDEKGKFSSYKIIDPSFHNWIGLAMALRRQQISDFPLCNKSFNLSYCGHDL